MGKKGSLNFAGWEDTRGTKSRNAVLTEEQVRDIKRSTDSSEQLALTYKVSFWTIMNIRRGRSWRHVKP